MEDRKTGHTPAVHNIIMESRHKLGVSGVTDVESFNEEEIILHTGMGALIVKGRDLHINKLSVEIGEVSMEGSIDSLQYADIRKSKGTPLLARLFK